MAPAWGQIIIHTQLQFTALLHIYLRTFQGGHIPAEIKFPVFSLCYELFPCVFFSILLIDGFE